jgi:hypothetical protein
VDRRQKRQLYRLALSRPYIPRTIQIYLGPTPVWQEATQAEEKFSFARDAGFLPIPLTREDPESSLTPNHTNHEKGKRPALADEAGKIDARPRPPTWRISYPTKNCLSPLNPYLLACMHATCAARKRSHHNPSHSRAAMRACTRIYFGKLLSSAFCPRRFAMRVMNTDDCEQGLFMHACTVVCMRNVPLRNFARARRALLVGGKFPFPNRPESYSVWSGVSRMSDDERIFVREDMDRYEWKNSRRDGTNESQYSITRVEDREASHHSCCISFITLGARRRIEHHCYEIRNSRSKMNTMLQQFSTSLFP